MPESSTSVPHDAVSSGDWQDEHLSSLRCVAQQQLLKGGGFYKLDYRSSDNVRLVRLVLLCDQDPKELGVHAKQQLSTDNADFP